MPVLALTDRPVISRRSPCVLKVRHEPQMLRVYAHPLFADVVKRHPTRNLSMHVLPRGTVRENHVVLAHHAVVPADLGIPMTTDRVCAEPATASRDRPTFECPLRNAFGNFFLVPRFDAPVRWSKSPRTALSRNHFGHLPRLAVRSPAARSRVPVTGYPSLCCSCRYGPHATVHDAFSSPPTPQQRP